MLASEQGKRAYGVAPYPHGQMITLIGAITVEQVITTMTVNGGTDGRVFRDESYSDASSSFVVRSLCCCRQFTST